MSKYFIKLNSLGSQIYLEEGTQIKSIPNDPGNVDYQDFLLWIEAGNTPLTVEEPAPTIVPTIEQRTQALELLVDYLLEPTP